MGESADSVRTSTCEQWNNPRMEPACGARVQCHVRMCGSSDWIRPPNMELVLTGCNRLFKKKVMNIHAYNNAAYNNAALSPS